MKKKKKVNFLKSGWHQFKDIAYLYKKSNSRQFASSVAFFILFSIIPIIVLLFSFIPYLPFTENDVLVFLATILPANVEQLTIKIVGQLYGRSPAVISISALLLIWSSGKAMQGVRSGLNSVNGITEMCNFIVLRLKAILYTVIFVIVMIIFASVFLFANFILQIITNIVHIQLDLVKFIFDYRFIVEWIFLSFFMCLVYGWLPDKKHKPHQMWRGGFFAGLSMTLVTWGFYYYMNHFNMLTMYGSLATVVIILFWLYTMCMFFMYGGIINVYYLERDSFLDEEGEIDESENVRNKIMVNLKERMHIGEGKKHE